ncbi:MAG: tRNA-Thr(GGU) m(6)t(6)A37 methyltransferase TsaA [Akkermansiaceae bacterium]|jgi:tRNA-Thr(GGU) m(6)t(6)A37 methyltransferase TsaA
MSDEIFMRPIGRVESCFGEKFGTPRQSGIVPEAKGRVVFSDEVPAGACRGLEEFSHVWIVFLFDQVEERETRWFVRPPRLGGNEKKGVFATRSPFRPNRIGLSLVTLDAVSDDALEVSGLDLVDGTVVLDIKPYLPYVESVTDAKGGFAKEAPRELEVEFSDEIRVGFSEEELALITRVLAVDPRPAYHDDEERIYGCLIAGYNVKWQVRRDRVIVLSSDPLIR